MGLISCQQPLFVDAPLAWADVAVSPEAGMDALRDAINGSDREKPTRITAAPGVYQGQCLYVEDHLRSEAAPLLIRGGTGENAPGAVQIDCSDGNGQAFAFVHSSWIGVEGFTFGPDGAGGSHYGDTGIKVSGRPYMPNDRQHFGKWEASHHFVLRNNVMRNLHRGPDGDANPDHYESACCDGAKANQTEWIWYIGNTISRVARHGIDNVGVHHAAACNNIFYDLVGEGQGIESKGGSYDILFEANRMDRVFHRGLMMGGEGTNSNFMWPADFPTEAYGVVARNNVIVNASDGGLGFYGCWNCTATHNSIWFTPGYTITDARDFIRAYPSVLEGGVFDEWGAATRAGEVLTNQDCTIINNVFGAAAGNATCPLDAAGDGQGTVRFTIENNRFYNGGDPLPNCGEGPTSILGFADAGATLTEPPGLANEGGFPDPKADLTPVASSPLVAAGKAHPANPVADAAGKPRPAAGAIGALEP